MYLVWAEAIKKRSEKSIHALASNSKLTLILWVCLSGSLTVSVSSFKSLNKYIALPDILIQKSLIFIQFE